MDFNKLPSLDQITLFFTTLFFLHGSSYIAFHTPAIVWAFVVICLFLLLVHSCSKTWNWLLYLLPLVTISIIWKIAKSNNILGAIEFGQFLSGTMQYSIWPLLTYYLITKNNLRYLWYVFFVFCSVEITTGISTISACALDPTLARMDYGTLRVEDPVLYEFRMNLNVGDYHTAYGFTAMLPIAIIFYKWASHFPSRYLTKALSLVICFIMVFTVYRASYTIALTICLVLLVLFLFPAKISKSYFLTSLIVMVIFAYVFRLIMPSLFDSLADILNNDVMSTRLHDLADSIAKGENTADAESDFNLRILKYQKSLDCFYANPILGSWSYEKLGGHSYIFDNLGLMGLFGLGLLLIMWKTIWNRYISIFIGYPWFYYICYSLVAILFFFITNPDDMTVQLLFFFPTSCYIIAHYTDIEYK